MKLLRLLVVGLAVLALTACGLLDETKQRAETVKQSLASLAASLEQERSSFQKIETADAALWEFILPYATREGWSAKFDAVGSDIAGLQATFDRDAKPILDANKEETDGTLIAVLAGIEQNIDPLQTSIKFVKDRINLLRTGKEQAPAWIETSRGHVASLDAAIAALPSVIAETKTAFAERAGDIDMRFAPLSKLVADAHASLTTAEAQFASHSQGGETDYAVFADSVKSIEAAVGQFATEDAEYREDLKSLYEDNTVVLRDMKIEFLAQVGRTSWHEGESEWPTETEHLYNPVSISEADFEYLSKLADGDWNGQQGSIGLHAWGIFSGWETKSYIDQGVWDRLKVVADNPPLPPGDNMAGFWLAELEPVYFHKYATVSGTNVTEGDWEEVDDFEYGQYADSFGMAIESKPLGRFSDEAIEEPTPVGMEMVGDDRYGEWKQDPATGNTFWHYYGQYAFINGLLGGNGPFYSQADYNNYRSWKEERRNNAAAGTYGWYGSDRTKPTYGSSGSHTTKTASYAASPFAKSGGAKTISPSLRDAGISARSRGPGAGGK
jgi:hypothetical protein